MPGEAESVSPFFHMTDLYFLDRAFLTSDQPADFSAVNSVDSVSPRFPKDSIGIISRR